mmetsp:Transcript_45045/g.141204  ORF Transcript_45045/g.141204 Transcript_45045/m.141204 type:complete len:420 (+) Transcript_45045:42-1301(+)
MPAGVLHAAFAAVASPQHPEAALLPGPHEPWPTSAVSSLAGTWTPGPRRNHARAAGEAVRSGFEDAAGKANDTGGGEGKGGEDKGGGDDKGKDAGAENKGGNAKVLLYTSQTGKTVEVSGESKAKCLQSCKDAPELKDENQSGVNEVMSVATGGERSAIQDCEQFCNGQFSLSCFPGDSSVVVRDRGRVRLADLRVGDAVLALGGCGSGAGGRWELLFDTVITWLHRDPDAEGEVLQIRHDAGQVQLTASHLLFARRPGAAAAVPCQADEVRPGDRLLAPWFDGSMAEPAVLSVDRVRRRGLYAPLVSCGTVFVDGAAASCYALPLDLHASPLLRRVSRLADGRGLHAAAHAALLPLRLLHAAAAASGRADTARQPPCGVLDASREEKLRQSKALPGCKEAPIHPYAWVLYVLAASFLT